MAKAKTHFVCQSCGAGYRKWTGQCESCGAWNSLAEETAEVSGPKSVGTGAKGRRLDFVGLKGDANAAPRLPTGVAEFDRALGGGLVAGSAILLGGDPGIGKSTLLLQMAGRAAAKTAYITGEEAVEQVRLRARRLNLAGAEVDLAAATNLRDILATLDGGGHKVVVIDSIQTLYADTLDSAPGTVSQVRACALELIRLAKRRGFAVILVGHVTKDGQIAGPRVLEHMVDTVLYFEGDRGHQFRILRAVKNRFGAADEIGVFEMADTGLVEVPNPSALFIGDRDRPVSGAAVFAGMEGTRPVLVEIQALVASSAFGTPRRAVVGWDTGRLNMILAVLDARCGISLSGHDVYLNVAGGMKIAEPAADLAVAAALISAIADEPIETGIVALGEIGLSGEIRPVSQLAARLKEAAKLGFNGAWRPTRRRDAKEGRPLKISVELSHLQDLVTLFGKDVARIVRPAESGGSQHL